jgi:WD40 repeat protein
MALFSEQLAYAEGMKGGKLFAYVGGIQEVAKIDMQTYGVTSNSSSFPGGGIVFGVQISPDGKEIYVTGDWFSVPLMVLDSRSLQITKKLDNERFKHFQTGLGFGSRGRLSPDGRRFVMELTTGATTHLYLMDTANFSLINKPKNFRTNPIYQVVFSDDSKFIYILSPYQEIQGKVMYEKKIIILESETGKELKQYPLPDFEKIPCQTNISKYIGKKSEAYISCYGNFYDGISRGLQKGNYLFPSMARSDSPKIMIMEVNTGKVIDEIPTPETETNINTVTLTPDGGKLLVGSGAYRHPGELAIVDVKSKKIIKRVMLNGGAATSNIVFGYE